MKRVRLGPQGRAVIPSEFRQQLKMIPGDELVAWVEDGRLILQRRDDIECEIWAMFADVKESMAEELIADRRREAAREL